MQTTNFKISLLSYGILPPHSFSRLGSFRRLTEPEAFRRLLKSPIEGKVASLTNNLALCNEDNWRM
jgi:hypothetical protein